MKGGVTPRAVLLGLLGGSLLLRLVLIQLGGQLYWSDEFRYLDSRKAAAHIAAGECREAHRALSAGDHPLFRTVGLVPALVEHAAEREDTRIPAAFFGLFSVLNIWLVSRLARRLGASEWEAALASLLAALASCLAYWARHISPYDLSMSLGLLAVLAGLRRPTARASLLCGSLAALAFLLYAGYWTLAALAVGLHVVQDRSPREGIRRALLAGLGSAAVLAAVIGADAAMGGQLPRQLVAFSRTVYQGVYSEGGWLPFEYLWHSEHLLLAAWLLAIGWSLRRAAGGTLSPSEAIGLTGIAFVYGSLFVSSVVLHKFVVYGRLVRQLLPFACLVTASRLEALRGGGRRSRLVFAGVLVLLSVQALVNFRGPLSQTFPREFTRDDSRRGNFGVRRRDGRVLAVNATTTHPLPDPVELPRRYLVLEEAPHPREFLPYQYEGTSPAERALVRSTDIRMRLILAPPEKAP